MEASLTQEDVKKAMTEIGFDPERVGKLRVEVHGREVKFSGAFALQFADKWSGWAAAVALDSVDPKHGVIKDNGSGVRAAVWPQPTGGRAHFPPQPEMPRALEAAVARWARHPHFEI